MKNFVPVKEWLSACSSVMRVTSGKAACKPWEIIASAASSAAVTGLESDLVLTSKSGPL